MDLSLPPKETELRLAVEKVVDGREGRKKRKEKEEKGDKEKEEEREGSK